MLEHASYILVAVALSFAAEPARAHGPNGAIAGTITEHFSGATVSVASRSSVLVPAAVHEAGLDTSVVAAGDPEVDGRLLPRGRWSKRVLLADGDDIAELGTLTQELKPARLAGRSGLLSIQIYHGSTGVTTDSAFVDARTLAPVLHRSHNADRVMTLDFDARMVTGRVVPANGDRAVDVDQRTETAVFDSNVTDLVIAALPLEPGYRARIPYYIYERGGLVWNDVRVVGVEDVRGDGRDPVSVWVVAVTVEGTDGESRYWIARETRRVIRSSRRLADGREVRYVRTSDPAT